MEYSVYKLSDNFDLTQYKNTRFMYNPNTKQIILGSEYDSVEDGSHADLYYNAMNNTNIGYDDFFIKGWIGFGGRKYKNGVIHFAPNIRPEQSEVVMQAIDLVEKLKKHGFTDNTWVRGLVRFDEYKIKDMYEKIQNWQDDVKPYTEQLQDWVNCSFVKDKVYKIAEGVYTTDELKARYHNSDLKSYFLRIECPKILKGKLTESFNKLAQKGFDGIIMGKTFRVFNEAEQVREAKAVIDANVREKIQQISEEVGKQIKRSPNYGLMAGTKYGYGYLLKINSLVQNLFSGFDQKPFYIFFTEKKESETGSYMGLDDFDIIIMNILCDDALSVLASCGEKKKELAQAIRSWVYPAFMNHENSFIHELVHAVDNKRLKNYKGRKKSQLDMDNKSYLSDPLEFNAWFQSNIQEFDGIQTLEKDFGRNWNTFYSYVLDCLPFVKDYNEKYRRKFDVRLWKYWNEFIKEGSKKQVKEAKFNYGNLYHGTDASFNVFDKKYITGGYLGKGFYFTMSKNMAKNYGKNVIEAKLNYNNSFIFDSDVLDDNSLIKILDTSNANNTIKKDIFNQYKDLAKRYSIFDANAKFFDLMDFYKGDTTKVLKELGYDSIDNIERDSEFLVFEPTQIKIIKQVNESLKNEGGFFITNSGRDILNLLQNKPKEYRIVYDANLGLFMICDANEGIHADMLEKAYKNGLYYNMDKFIDSLGSFQNYIETGQDGGWDENDNEISSFLYYMIFDPTGQWEVGDDDYDTVYKLPFGNLFTRKCDLSEIPFYNMLPLTEQLNEAVNPKLNDNFWKWFGKSVCRDKNGNPIIFYHGTPNADLSELRGGTYFTQNKDYADGYQDQFASMLTRKKEARKPGTYAVYLKIENPFDTRKKKCRDEFYKYYYQQMGSGTDLQESGLPDWTDGRDLLEFLTEYHPELGYDGLLLDEGGHYDIHGGLVYRGISYLPLSSNQIKSVDNNGNWSTTSNNIYESYDYIDNIEVIINPTKKEFDDFVKKNKWYRILLTNNSIAIWSADTPLLHYQVENEYDVTGTTLFCHKGNVYFQDWDLVDVEDDMKEYYIEQAEKLDNNSILKQYFPNIHMKQDTIDMLSGKKVIYESKEPNLNQNFWHWFGDSVCVDDTGAPKVLYHGTSSEFTKFKKGFIFTTDNQQVADGYGYYGAMPVFVKISNPFIVDAFNQDWQEIYNAEGFKKKYKELTDEDIEKLYKAYEYFESLEDAKQYYEESKKYNPDDYINLARAYGQKPHSTNEWAQYAKNKGYDGCIIKNVVDGFSLSDCINPINEYIVWNPEQVKSVNNNGEWSESDKLMEQK